MEIKFLNGREKMKKEFHEDLRDQAMSLLTSEQQNFILNLMKRGKRTAWLNVMAAMKGVVISLDDDEQAIVEKIGGWVLTDFEDLGTRDGKCECGQSIRYVYHVTHVENQKRLVLGSKCIESYTGLDAKTVSEIKNGVKKIDYELDEILDKVVNGWRLNFDVPETITIPNDIQQHLAMGLPLLDRQVARLKVLIDTYYREKQINERLYRFQQTKPIVKHVDEEEPFDLFSTFEESTPANNASTENENSQTQVKTVTQTKIPDSWANFIHKTINKLQQEGQVEITALEMAEEVAMSFGYGNDRYLTGKPRTYFLVARYLDEISAIQDVLELVNANKENRWYLIRNTV